MEKCILRVDVQESPERHFFPPVPVENDKLLHMLLDVAQPLFEKFV